MAVFANICRSQVGWRLARDFRVVVAGETGARCLRVIEIDGGPAGRDMAGLTRVRGR